MKVVINIKIRNEESEYELWPWWWRKIEDKVEINIEEEDDTEKQIRKIKEKTERHKLLNYSEWCSINSYIGWIQYCDHYRLYEKYIIDLIPSLCRFYYFVITNKNKKKSIRYHNNVLSKKF